MEIFYGIRNDDGKVVSIDEIPDDKPGLQCNCICTYCKRALQACSLNGMVRRYFRHHTDVIDANRSHVTHECSSYSANETALHLMAKQILSEEKKILTPPKNVSMRDAGILDIPYDVERHVSPYQLQTSRLVVAEEVKLEEHLDGFTPDVLIKTNRGELLVEIFVRHRVDNSKKEKVAQYGSAMLELDLSDFLDDTVKSDELKSAIISSEKHKEWIYYPLSKETLDKAKHYYDNHVAVKKHRARILEEKRKREKEQADRERRNKKIKELFEPQKYATELEHLRDDDAFVTSCEMWHKNYWFPFAQHYKQNKEVPFFIDIPITGEMIFQCDRRIWQSLIFNRYIYGRKDDSARICVNGIFDALKNDYNIKVDYDLTYKLTDPQDDEHALWLREEVVCKYMDYLEDIGFIDSSFEDTCEDWRTVKARRTIDPPLSKEAKNLSSAIQSIDSQSPCVDVLISRKFIEYCNEQQKNESEENHEQAEKFERLQEEKTQLQGHSADLAEEQKRHEIRQILNAKTTSRRTTEEPVRKTEHNDATKSTFPQGRPVYDPCESPYYKKSDRESEAIRISQAEPVESSNVKRKWICVYCGKKATKSAFSKFTSMEDNLGVCTMCFHASLQRSHRY